MKRMRRKAALLLAAILCINSFSVNAWAEGDPVAVAADGGSVVDAAEEIFSEEESGPDIEDPSEDAGISEDISGEITEDTSLEEENSVEEEQPEEEVISEADDQEEVMEEVTEEEGTEEIEETDISEVGYATSSNWKWPTTTQRVTATWPRYSGGSYHSGIDFGAELNSPVYSTCDGTVDTIKSMTTSYGKHIIIKAKVNGATVYMYYCHLNKFGDISEGEKVSAGKLIGYSGSTGNSTGPHLHYEVRNSSKHYGSVSDPTLNPTKYLPGTSYTYETNGTVPDNTHTVDSNYPKKITAVPIATSGTIQTYDINGTAESNRWIDYNDTCTINEVYTDKWCLVTYPSGSEKRTAYVKKNVFFAGDSIINSSWSPSSNLTAYKRSNMAEAFGSVWTTDTCKVAAQSGSKYQVIFPLDSGGYKLGWVLPSSTITPDPERPSTTVDGPVASGAFNGKKIVAVAPDKITFSSSAYIDKGDVCRLYNVDPSTGQCTVDYPSGSNNVFTASSVKTRTVSIDSFIKYNGSAQAETAKIPEKLTAYPTSAMTATVGSYTSNWYLDPGDTYTTINKIGSATEVLYYCSTGAHAGYWKLGWVNLSYYSVDLNGYLDNQNAGTLSNYGTADVYINGVKRGNDVNDFYVTNIPRGSTYEIKDIRAYTGYTYNGVTSGSLSGTVKGNIDVRLNFTKNPAKETGISVVRKPVKMEYIEGEKLDTAGLSVVMNYDDGSTKDITSSCSFSSLDSTIGTQTVIVTYGSYSTAFNVIINDKTPVKMIITKLPDKLVYQVGDSLDLSGIGVTIEYDNGTSAVKNDYYTNCEDSLLETAGKKTVRVEYSEDATTIYATYEITVETPIAPATISAASGSVGAGKSFSVPLVVTGNPGLASMKLQVAYDESALTLTNIFYNSAWGGNFQQPQTMNSPVILNWYNGSENYTGDSVFATLTFTAKNVASDVSTKLSVTYDPEDVFNIDERNVGLKFSMGTINIIPASSSPLQITSQPVSVSTEAGKTVAYRIGATGNGLTYQWQYSSNSGYSWVNATSASAKTDTYSFSATETMDGRLFRCIVKDSSGASKTSNVVQLAINRSFAITSQPSSVQAGINSTVSFHVAASGQNLSYRWQYSKNGGERWIYSNAAGANTDTISIKVSASNAPNIYRCQVTSATGAVLYSETAGVDVLTGVVIVLNPQSQAVPIGEYAIFTIEAENAAGYQWQYSKDGAHWYNSGAEGNTTDTLKVKAAQNSQGNRYRCVVLGTDGNKKKSLACAMIVMTEAPKYSTVAVGGTASYSVKAEGITGYQWQYSKDGGQTWYKSGATGAETNKVTFKVTTANRLNIYRCKLTTEDGAYAFTAPVGFVG